MGLPSSTTASRHGRRDKFRSSVTSSVGGYIYIYVKEVDISMVLFCCVWDIIEYG